MSVKIFLNVNDSRWKKYRIDFAHIVNVAMDVALREDKTQKIIDQENRERDFNAFAGMGRWFGTLGLPFGEIKRQVSITMTNDAEIQKLNKQYRKIDKPTNVLSFETGDAEMLGDIFIAFDTTMKEVVGANENSPDHRLHSRANAYPPESSIPAGPGFHSPLQSEFINHTTHLVVHGILHLMGYDHQNESDAVAMESMEAKILAKLGIDNPYEERNKEKGIRNKIKISKINPKTRKITWLFAGLSFLCGVIASFGFAPFELWPLTIIGIGGAYAICFRKSQGTRNRNKEQPHRSSFLFLVPFLFGMGYAASSFWWMLNSIYVVPELAKQFAVWTIPGIVGIALAGGIVFGLPFVLTNFVLRFTTHHSLLTTHYSRPIIFAAMWTFVLWLREWLFTGFPWNPMANITLPWPGLSNSMALFGALGLTFVIIGFIASIVEILPALAARGSSLFVLQRSDSKAGRGRAAAFNIKGNLIFISLFASLLAIGIGYGYYNIRITNYLKTQTSNFKPFVVRIVQPAESAVQKATHSREEAMANAEDNVRNLMQLSATKAETGVPPDLIVWPETAYPYLIPMDGDGKPLADRDGKPLSIFRPAAVLGVPMIAGANTISNPFSAVAGDSKFFNSMIIAGADGRIQQIYSKSHLVPFGEYRPFGDIIPTPGQLTPGRGPEIISMDVGANFHSPLQFQFAPAICYEIIFSDSLVPRGARPMAIVNITNDTWFGRTPGTYQHLALARRYAIESGLPIVRADYSGISAFIAADGHIIQSLPIGVTGILDGTIPGHHMTPYRWIGRDGTMLIILGFAALILLIPIRGARKKG